MKQKHYLVVGGAGFIGHHLVTELLKQKKLVTVLDNLSTGKKTNLQTKARFVKADIRQLKQIQPYFYKQDGVFLLAAIPRVQYSIEYPAETNRNNIEGVLNVLIAAQKAQVSRLVYSASSSAYGNPVKLPLQEYFKPNPLSPYGLQKYVGEEYCKLYSLIHKLKTVSLRYFNVYGPGMADQGAYVTVMSIFLQQKLKKQPLTITGDGTQTRDFTYVADVVRANILAMNSPRVGQGEVINIGAGKNYSINQIAEFFNSPIKYIPARLEPHDTLADISLAKKLLNWQPRVKLETGIKKVLAWKGF